MLLAMLLARGVQAPRCDTAIVVGSVRRASSGVHSVWAVCLMMPRDGGQTGKGNRMQFRGLLKYQPRCNI